MNVKIYRPTKTAMQSGRARTKEWIIEFMDPSSGELSAPMGWTAQTNMLNEVSLRFATQEEAIAFAEHHGWEYDVQEPAEFSLKLRAYGDNFTTERL